MGLDFFRLEKGIHLVGENTEVGVKLLLGAGAPGGTTDTDNAEQGSQYQDTSGNLYIKYTSGTGTDRWKRIARAEEISSGSYLLSNVDEAASYIYVGKIADTAWLVKRVSFTLGEATMLYANASNNPTITTYNDAWTNRVTLTYDIYSDLTGV